MEVMKNDMTHKIKKFLNHYVIACSLLLIILVLCLVDTTLVSVRNFRNIVSNLAPMLLLSSGMALCLFSGYVDLSAGAIAAFSGLIAGSFVQRPDIAGRIFSFLPAISPFIIIPITIVLFYLLGMLYGTIIHSKKIPSWFFTLAFSSILMGLGYMYVNIPETQINQVSGFSSQFLQFGVGYIGSGPTYSIPFTIIVSVIALTLVWFYLCKSKLELKPHFSHLERRNSKKNVRLIFSFSCALFSLAGIMITARNGVASPTIGFGVTSDALAICLIAGFSLYGSKGNLKAVFISAFIYCTLIYCVTFIGMNEYISLVIRGIILLCAMLLELQVFSRPQNDTKVS